MRVTRHLRLGRGAYLGVCRSTKGRVHDWAMSLWDLSPWKCTTYPSEPPWPRGRMEREETWKCMEAVEGFWRSVRVVVHRFDRCFFPPCCTSSGRYRQLGTHAYSSLRYMHACTNGLLVCPVTSNGTTEHPALPVKPIVRSFFPFPRCPLRALPCFFSGCGRIFSGA